MTDSPSCHSLIMLIWRTKCDVHTTKTQHDNHWQRPSAEARSETCQSSPFTGSISIHLCPRATQLPARATQPPASLIQPVADWTQFVGCLSVVVGGVSVRSSCSMRMIMESSMPDRAVPSVSSWRGGGRTEEAAADTVKVVEDFLVRIDVHIPPVARSPLRKALADVGPQWAARDRIERANMCVSEGSCLGGDT